MTRQRVLSTLIVIVWLIVAVPALAGTGAGVHDAPAPSTVVVPVDVWEVAAGGGVVDVLVVLRDRADLSVASASVDRQARGEQVQAALWHTAGEAQRALRAHLDAAGVAYRPFYIVNAIHLTADEALLRELAARPEVERVVPNTPVPGIPPGEVRVPATAPEGIEPNLLRINADDVWALGYTGEGVVVAGQDTGYDWDHPALIGQYRGWDGGVADHDYNWHDAIHENNSHTADGNPCGFDSSVPCDDSEHGTHTMGTIAGDDGGLNRIGVAPGARWIGCRNMEQGWGTPATYLECFEFFLAPYPVGGTPEDGVAALAPHVVNNSWGCPPQEGCDAAAIDLLDEAVSALRQAGIVVVASAGNSGSACETVVNPPAIARDALSVAAFSHLFGEIASFSSRGPVTDELGTYLKPNLAAPGVSVRSSVPGGGYSYMSGTSMAAPHVAGAVALILSAAPEYARDADTIDALMLSTAVPRTTVQACDGDLPDSVPNNVWGWGELDVLAAVEVAQGGVLQGTVRDAESGAPLANVHVSAAVPGWPALGGETATNQTGSYSLALPAGDYLVVVRIDGYGSRTLSGVTVVGGETTVVDVALKVVMSYYLPLVLVP